MSMVDEGLRIRVTVVIFATGKTNSSQFVGMLFQLRSLFLVHHIIISCYLSCYMYTAKFCKAVLDTSV